jgi:hypothetical protein
MSVQLALDPQMLSGHGLFSKHLVSYKNMVMHFLFTRTVSRVFCFTFFHESSSAKPLKITLESFQFFPKFAEIFTSQDAPRPPVSKILPISGRRQITLAANNGNNIRLLTT